jgi:hypothetical protein
MKVKCFLLLLILAFVCFPYGPLGIGDPVLVRGVTHGKISAMKIIDNGYDTLITIQANDGRVFQESASYCCHDFPPQKSDDLIEIIRDLIILGTFSGVIPALAIILAISIIIGLVRGTKKTTHRVVHSEEYRRKSDAERQNEIQLALKETQNKWKSLKK